MRFQPVYSLLCFPSLVALFFFAANSALAISPEPGLYYDAAQSGKGFYIDVQQGTGLIIFYAGNPGTGKPEYYLQRDCLGRTLCLSTRPHMPGSILPKDSTARSCG
jgi:hypothetical protein